MAMAAPRPPAGSSTTRCESLTTVPTFGCQLAQGKRDDRHTGLAGGEAAADGTFQLNREAKLRLDVINPGILRQAAEADHRLAALLRLTDPRGNPPCASVPRTSPGRLSQPETAGERRERIDERMLQWS